MNKDILGNFQWVWGDVVAERLRQEQLHPGDTCWELGKPWRDELIQVAAVCVAWVQALDRAEEAKSWPT